MWALARKNTICGGMRKGGGGYSYFCETEIGVPDAEEDDVRVVAGLDVVVPEVRGKLVCVGHALLKRVRWDGSALLVLDK